MKKFLSVFLFLCALYAMPAFGQERFSFYGIEFQARLNLPVCDENTAYRKVCYLNMRVLRDDVTSGGDARITGRGFEEVLLMYPDELQPAFTDDGAVFVGLKDGVVFDMTVQLDASKQKEIMATLKAKMGDEFEAKYMGENSDDIAVGSIYAVWQTKVNGVSVPIRTIYVGELVNGMGMISIALLDGQYKK